MRFSKILCYVFLLLFVIVCSARAGGPGNKVLVTPDGVVIYPDTSCSGNTRAVKLQVISDKIIRVTASATREIPEIHSLITVYTATVKNWTAIQKGDKVVVETPQLTATVLISTGAVQFAGKDGKPIVMERQHNGRLLTPAVFDGQSSYGISQTFDTTPDDAYYGLGQHQDNQFNYKGGQVFMFQNNTEVAVPFLLSSRNYGILWDNYSLTKVGDTREFMQLSDLKLFSQQGDEGWLTASYSNDQTKPEAVAFTRAEARIDYPYLDDTRKNLPKEFNPQNGLITWQGQFASGASGLHSFRVTYGGYIKIWVDEKLLADKWRQSWNPGSALFRLDLQKNKKYALKIQWIPNGSESYLGVKWQRPVPPADASAYTFASEAGKALDYYFICGNNADDVIAGYRAITGKATIVPKWAMGFWQSRERYKTQAEILSTVAEFRKRKIPLDNIVQDWSYWKENDWGSQDFDASRFPDPDSMIQVLHGTYHTRFMISVWPKMYEGIPAYNDFNAKGWLYKRNIADRQRDWINQGYISTFYDAFNDKAKQGFWNLLNKKLYSKGVDAWWMDASEPDILSNVSPEKRKAQMTPTALGAAAEYLNAYPLENAKGIYRGQRSVDPDKRVFLLTRSGFAGSQHYAAAIWSGDIAARWEDMRTQISAGLNFSLSGLPFWTMDIGGFAVERRNENAQGEALEAWRELQARWFQFGSFVPLFRVHGQFPFREIFNIAPEDHPAYKSILYYNKLRYRLMPYLYTLAGMAYHNDYTLMRGLIMDFPKDTAVKNIGDQFMLGPSLLINPVYTYQERSRTLYLPAGQGWYNLYSGKFEAGGRKISAAAAYDTMPVFVKEGSIIPFGPELQYTAEKKADTITLYVYTGKDAQFKLYEDEDLNYNYEKGAFSNIPITYRQSGRQLTIGARQGSFAGMLPGRTFRIVWVTAAAPKSLDLERKADKEIFYDGKQVTIGM